MDCQLLERLLPNYLDDELTEEMAQDIQAHLVGCRHCAWEVESIRQAVSVLRRAVADPECRAQFREKLLAELIRDHRVATARQPYQMGTRQSGRPAKPVFVLDPMTEESDDDQKESCN
jgi:anti-sigma factor RsiW